MKGGILFLLPSMRQQLAVANVFSWHSIPMGTDLNQEQVEYIVDIIMEWIQREERRYKN